MGRASGRGNRERVDVSSTGEPPNRRELDQRTGELSSACIFSSSASPDRSPARLSSSFFMLTIEVPRF